MALWAACGGRTELPVDLPPSKPLLGGGGSSASSTTSASSSAAVSSSGASSSSPAASSSSGAGGQGPLEALAFGLGQATTCVVVPGARVACWGDNSGGQLGLGGLDYDHHPKPQIVPNLDSVQSLALGSFHACARLFDGTLRCWGDNGVGQLGISAATSIGEAGPVDGLGPVDEVAAGASFTCARQSGHVQCWGANYSGQLGCDTPTRSASPLLVDGVDDAVELALSTEGDGKGEAATCARRASGGVVCWGGNQYGQLGDGTQQDRSTPAAIVGITDAIQISSGYLHACALHADGTVSCWGWNALGELCAGQPEGAAVATPVLLPIQGAIRVFASTGRTCVELSDHSYQCCGSETAGVLGDGKTISSQPALIAIPAIAGATQLTLGWGHSCAKFPDGSLRCWGQNGLGQLGVPNADLETTPTIVSW